MQARLFILVLVSMLTIGGVANATREHIKPAKTPPVCTENQRLNEAKDTCIAVTPEPTPAPAPAQVPAPAPALTPVPQIQPVPPVENWGK
jgi:hypothetical protein